MTTNKKVLLVDDDIDILDQLTMIFKGEGFEIVTAQSENEAEEALTRFEPDLVILDVMMEHRDSGFVLCHHIKKMYPETPIIIYSSVTSVTGMDFPSGGSDGSPWIKAQAVLNKPVRSEVLLTEVRRLLQAA